MEEITRVVTEPMIAMDRVIMINVTLHVHLK